MRVSRPNEIRGPGARLHPKACAVLELEAERVTSKHLGTPVPGTCMHAFESGYARKSGEPLGFRPKEAQPRPSRDLRHQSGLAGCKLPPLFKR